MNQKLHIHPTHPQLRLIMQASKIISMNGVIAYPTDSAYALGCCIGNQNGVKQIRLIREISDKHNLTLVCKDLSDIARYAQVNNSCYRFLKNYTPGAYTFILKGTREIPRKLIHPKRKTIGIRIPDCPITQSLLHHHQTPLISTTLQLPGQDFPMTDPEDIYEILGDKIDLLIDGGNCGSTPTSVIDLTNGTPCVLRVGKGCVKNII